jgi:hypothetical protein
MQICLPSSFIQDAQRAIEGMNGVILGRRPIRTNWAVRRTSVATTSGGGGGAGSGSEEEASVLNGFPLLQETY